MSYLKQFIFPVRGLGPGRKSFKYKIGKEFFEQFENSEIEQANILLDLEVNKQTNIVVLEFNISGTVLATCDRCLDEFNLEIENNQSLYIKFGSENDTFTDEMIVISEQKHELDLSQHIYEFINLSLPIKKVHGTDKNGNSLCNKEMIKKLNKLSVEEETKTDPRWNKLKDLM